MSKKKELNNEELEKVAGGSHVSPSNIKNYVGKDMIFSYGIFGIHGPYPVHINGVNGTIVNMTFKDPNNHPSDEPLLNAGWTKLDEHTWLWDYDDGCDTWLE